jgi:hypothetical protein
MVERNITFPLIRQAITMPDKIIEESYRRRWYKKVVDSRELNVVIRGKGMLVTTFWNEKVGEINGE